MIALPPGDRRLALAFFASVLLHFAALNTGPEHHGARHGQALALSFSPTGKARPAPPEPAPKRPHPQREDGAARPSAAPSRPREADTPSGDRTLALPGLPAPYHSILDLSREPRFEGEIPEFLPLSLSRGEGKVIFVLYLAEDGTLDRLESTSEGQDMDFAIRYLEQLIRITPIAPGEIDGEPVRTRWVLEFSLSPGGTELEQASSSPEAKP